jgi:hypothetical protein
MIGDTGRINQRATRDVRRQKRISGGQMRFSQAPLRRIYGGAGGRLRTGLPLSEQGIFGILSWKQGACPPLSTETSNFSRPFQRLIPLSCYSPIRDFESPFQGRRIAGSRVAISRIRGRTSFVPTAATKGAGLTGLGCHAAASLSERMAAGKPRSANSSRSWHLPLSGAQRSKLERRDGRSSAK